MRDVVCRFVFVGKNFINGDCFVLMDGKQLPWFYLDDDKQLNHTQTFIEDVAVVSHKFITTAFYAMVDDGEVVDLYFYAILPLDTDIKDGYLWYNITDIKNDPLLQKIYEGLSQS